MVAIDFHNDIIGNALKMALGLKGVAWHHEPGLAGKLDTNCVISRDDFVVTGEHACLLFLEQQIPEPSLFPNGNIGMPLALSAWRDKTAAIDDASYLKAQASLVMRQMHDGRPHLQGEFAGLADIQSAAWILNCDPGVFGTSNATLTDWCQRMKGFLEVGSNDIPLKISIDEGSGDLITSIHSDGCQRITSPLS